MEQRTLGNGQETHKRARQGELQSLNYLGAPVSLARGGKRYWLLKGWAGLNALVDG